MKKPITIGVIAVIATILVTSAVDYSAIGAKPTNEVYAQGNSRANGEIVCPDETQIPGDIYFSLTFSEDEDGLKGQFSATNQGVNPQSRTSSNLWTGSIDSGSYMFKGVGSASAELNDICGITPFFSDEVTVWGQCGEDVVINFETEDGITGFSTGTVACV